MEVQVEALPLPFPSPKPTNTKRALLQPQTGEVRTVWHYWLEAWPDHDVPDSTQTVMSFVHSTWEQRQDVSKQVSKMRRPARLQAHLSQALGCCLAYFQYAHA